jgi:hypothetical protein
VDVKQGQKLYVPMKLEEFTLESAGRLRIPLDINFQLPDGCVAVLFAFKTKKAAREFYEDKKVPLMTLRAGDSVKR